MKKALYLNKICYSLDKERDQFLHLRRLYTIKPTMKIDPPIKPKFLKINKSKLLKRAQTQLQIDYENDILYSKIKEIHSKTGEYNEKKLKPKNDYPAFRRSYYNYKYQDIEKMKTILEDNINLDNRLKKVKPYYKTEDINEEARKQEKYLNNILAKSKMIKRPSPLNYYDIEQYKNLVEAQNENENQDQNIIEEDEREGEEEEDEKEKKKKKEINDEKNGNEKENKENNGINNIEENKENEDENINNKEGKKNNASTTNNSTKDKNIVH